MPLKCSDPDKIVSRFAKSWHRWYVRPKVRPTLSSKRAQQVENRITFSQNRVTIEHPAKHAHCLPKSWHASQIVSRFFSLPNSIFESHCNNIASLFLISFSPKMYTLFIYITHFPKLISITLMVSIITIYSLRYYLQETI